MPEQTNLAKSIKDLTLKARFPYDYGWSQRLYDEFIDYMSFWNDKLFTFKQSEFKTAVTTNQLKIRQLKTTHCVFKDIVCQPVSLQSLIDSLGFKSLTVNSQNLEFQQSLDSEERLSKYINCGGLITSIKYLPRVVNLKSYLAVAVVMGENLVGHTELSIFYHGGQGTLKSALQIWAIDDDLREFELIKLLDTSKFGALSDLNWLPLSPTGYLGILSGLFKDGKVHFFTIDNTHQFGILQDSSISYQLEVNFKLSTITCYDYLSDNRIIVGTVTGHIAEFVLPNYFEMFPGNDEKDIDIPSFLLNVSYSPISSIAIGHPTPQTYLINVHAHGGLSWTIDYVNFWTRRLINHVSIIPTKYHFGLQLFLSSDSVDTVGFVMARHTHDKPTLILKTDGIITSTGISNYLQSPLILIGNSFGEVFVVNVARRILLSGKTNSKHLVPMKLWKLIYEGPNQIKVVEQTERVLVETPNTVGAAPNEIVISSLDWNDCIENSSVYAIGTHSGLLILEKLDH